MSLPTKKLFYIVFLKLLLVSRKWIGFFFEHGFFSRFLVSSLLLGFPRDEFISKKVFAFRITARLILGH